MDKVNATYKMLMSFTLMLTVLMVYSLTSYAAPDITKKPAKPASDVPATTSTSLSTAPEGIMMLSESGALTVSGDVRVNGILAKSGITVLSGSTLVVSENGLAMIDLTPFGRVTLGPYTTAKVTYAGGNLLIESVCDDMRVAVKQGQCNVVAPNSNTAAKVLEAGQDEHFDHAVEVTAKGFVDVVVNCGRDIVCPPAIMMVEPYHFPLFAFFILGGAAAIVGTSVIIGGPTTVTTTTTPPPVSGFQP